MFIQSFCEDGTMKVRVGTTLSDFYDQEQYVPQGCILSTTLFNIKINKIVTYLYSKTDGSLCVYDFGICNYIITREQKTDNLQQCMNRI